MKMKTFFLLLFNSPDKHTVPNVSLVCPVPDCFLGALGWIKLWGPIPAPFSSCHTIMPNTHRRRRRDETVESRRVGGVSTNSQLVGDSFIVSSV